jgi:hypothetical protein
MPPRLRTPCLALLVVLAFSSRTAAADGPLADAPTGKNCLGEARTKVLLAEGLYSQMNPLGLENQLQLGVCTPLVRKPGVLFDYTNAQAGLVFNASPVYAMPGVFVSVAPLSVLELRAEVAGIQNWTIGMDGSGYFPRASADDQFEDLPASLARSATGFAATFTATAQAEVALAPRTTVVAVNSFAWAYSRLGDAAYYYNPRYDLVMARQDWVAKNTAVLLVGRELSDRLKMRAGVTDELTSVSSSGSRQNVLAAIAMAVISRWPGVGDETLAFVRIGSYTDHAFRSGVQVLGGVSMTLDVTPARASRVH